MQSRRSRLFAVSALALMMMLATPGEVVGTSASSRDDVLVVSNQLGSGLALSRVLYNDTVVWRALRYDLPALIFEVPPDPDGDQWAFAHILEHNRMAVEFANFSGSGDLEPLQVFAGSLDEGGGPLQDVIVNASPEILPFVQVEAFDFAILVTTTEPIITDGGFIEVTLVR